MSDYDLLNEVDIDKLQDEIIREHEEEIRYMSNKSHSSKSKDQSQFQQSQQGLQQNIQQNMQQQLSQQEEEILNNMPFNKSTFASAHTLFSKKFNKNNSFKYNIQKIYDLIENASEMKFQDSQGEQRELNTYSNRMNNNNNFTKNSKDNRLDTELDYNTFNIQQRSINIQDPQKDNRSSRSNLPLQKSVKKTVASTEKQSISEGQFELIQQLESNQEEQIQDLKLYIQDLEQELNFLKPIANQNEQLWREIEQMKQKENKLTEYIVELENKVENQSHSIRSTTIDKLDQINNELIEKNIMVQQQNLLIQDLQHQISRLKDNNDCWKSQIDKERQENQELRTYREKNQEQREDLDENRKFKDLYMEIYEQHLELKISSQNQIFQLQQEVDSLISQMNRMQSQSNVQIDIENKNMEIQELEELLEKKDCQIQDMDQTFQMAKDEINSLNSQIELLKERIDQLEHSVYSKDTIIEEMQNTDYDEKLRGFIEKEQLFDAMTNNVCVFINDLRKSQCYTHLQSFFHESFLQSITNHNVEILDYYQFDSFISAALKQLESFMNYTLNEKQIYIPKTLKNQYSINYRQDSDNRVQYLYEADLKINQLNSEIESLKREREEFQPKALESFQVQEYQKQVELLSLQKIDLEVKNKQVSENMKLLKGECDHIHTKYSNKIEKKRIFFEKMIEYILKAINNKKLNEICEEIIDKIKDLDKRKVVKLQVEKKIHEIDGEIKINLAKQSQKDIEPLKKFKSQKVQELDDILDKIKISNQKMWSSYEKMKETCLYEKRIKEDLVECERDYLRLKIQFEENRKKYENSSSYTKSQQQIQSTIGNKGQNQSIKTFKPPLKQGSSNAISQLENDLIMNILSSDIQAGSQNTVRMNKDSRSTSQIGPNQKQNQTSSFISHPIPSQNNYDISQQMHNQHIYNQQMNSQQIPNQQIQSNNQTENINQKNRNSSTYSRNTKNNQNYVDTLNDRAYEKQRVHTQHNERSYNDENDMNNGNIQRENRLNVAPKGSFTQRQTSNPKFEQGEIIISLKDKLERNKKHLSLNTRK